MKPEKPHPFAQRSELLREASRCFVQVDGTEFWLRISKQKLRELADHLGGWSRLDLSLHRYFDTTYDLYVLVEPDLTGLEDLYPKEN